MTGLTEYADATTDLVKQSVQEVSKEVKKEIAAKFQHNLRQPTHKQIIFDRN